MQNLKNMGFNRFYLNVFLNCCLIFLSAFACFYFLHTRQQPSTAAGLAILGVILMGRLVFYVNRTNRILGNFLMYLQDDDPSLSYSVRYADRNFRGLNERLECLLNEFKESRMELEVQAKYLQAILGNVSTGILTLNDTGEVRTVNPAAGDYLDIRSIQHVLELDTKVPGLGKRILAMKPREQLTEKVHADNGIIQLSLNATRIKLKGEAIQIISINDISPQMEEQEIESWKKLMRVINHEIMNSMTPIITLTLAIRKKLMKGRKIIPPAEQEPANLEDALRSAGIIEERSKGLISFINRYKKLTSLPPLKIDRFSVNDLFSKMESLFGEELREKNIRLMCQKDCGLELEADRQMLEQVLINLVKNSSRAVLNRSPAEIGLGCFMDRDKRLCLRVSDNGEGIPADKLDQVFVPFYTSRQDGSGIGLSLCKQIMRLHGGHIGLESEPGKGTHVTLKF